MYTQFFGNYLLNQQLISPDHLADALQMIKNTRVKIGILAINAGLISAEQAEEVHKEQQRTDKRMGDIMIEKGYIRESQLEALLKSQQSGHLMLGQVLIDNGYMTTSQFAHALNSYKESNKITDADFYNVKDNQTKQLLSRFYNFNGTSESKYLVGYISLLMKNLIRFIGDDFTPMPSEKVENVQCNCCAYQKISGPFNATVIADADITAFLEFASRYAGEVLTEYGEMAEASVGEFLNLQNGLFSVNLSDEIGEELTLKPQTAERNMTLTNLKNAFKIPVCFSFGTVNFILCL
jgi:CheY-specific phosphatase CheX